MGPPLPTNGSPARPPWLLGTALVAVLWPALMVFPYAPETYLDASWQLTLLHAHVQGWQFGRDVIFTWGPWGFLNSVFHLGEAAAGPRLAWEIGGKLLMAAGLVAAIRTLRPVRQVLIVIACVLCASVFQDAAYQVFITVAGLLLLRSPRRPWGEELAYVALLAFLGLFKFTYLLLAAAGIGLAVAARLWLREWRPAAWLAGGFLAALLGGWLAAGQNPDNLVPYLRRSWEVSSGYPDAMAMEETFGVFLSGLALLGLAGAFLWRLARTANRSIATLAATLFLALAWLLAWKHGFTRADGHVLGFFLYALPLAVLLPGWFFPGRRWHWLDAAVIPCLTGLWLFDAAQLQALPGLALTRLRVNAVATFNSPRLPPAWQAELERARAAANLPAIRRAVGHATVDVYNYEQGVALLNGLNFKPRPVFQGYSAYTARLAGRNLRFYQSPAAPEYLLWHHSSIDERFPATDDAQLLAELPRGYRPVLSEGEFLLLRREKPLLAAPLARELIHRQIVGLGEPLAVPPTAGTALWVQVFSSATTLGKLRALFYKPAALNLTVEEVTGRRTTWRLLPRVAEDGFLLQPFVETQSDFAAFLRGRGRKQIRSVQLDAPAGRDFWKGGEIRFHALRELPIENDALHVEFVEQGVANAVPARVESPAALEFFDADNARAVLSHAPSALAFTPPAGATRLQAGFGLRPGAYTDGAHTDGVDFSVTATWPDGRTAVLWRRFLDPVRHSADRGTQALDLALPPDLPASLVLRTGPGPAGRTDWDWSYWTGIRFTPSAQP
jgi:hypothetical protein